MLLSARWRLRASMQRLRRGSALLAELRCRNSQSQACAGRDISWTLRETRSAFSRLFLLSLRSTPLRTLDSLEIPLLLRNALRRASRPKRGLSAVLANVSSARLTVEAQRLCRASIYN